jgi:hypothetical protein
MIHESLGTNDRNNKFGVPCTRILSVWSIVVSTFVMIIVDFPPLSRDGTSKRVGHAQTSELSQEKSCLAMAGIKGA